MGSGFSVECPSIIMPSSGFGTLCSGMKQLGTSELYSLRKKSFANALAFPRSTSQNSARFHTESVKLPCPPETLQTAGKSTGRCPSLAPLDGICPESTERCPTHIDGGCLQISRKRLLRRVSD